MRIVFVGAGELTRLSAVQLLDDGAEVVIIEQNLSRIEELGAELGAGFIHGDGSKPVILREADPSATDVILCLTGNDQCNVISSLVARSLGFARVVTRIEDASYEHICIELGLTDVIVPDQNIAQNLVDLCHGRRSVAFPAVIRGDARLYVFIVRQQDEGTLQALNLPRNSRVMMLYRDEVLILPEADTTLKRGDEVVLVCHSDALADLDARWKPLSKS